MDVQSKTQHLDAYGTKRTVTSDGHSYIEYGHRNATGTLTGGNYIGIVFLLIVGAVIKTGLHGYEVFMALPDYQVWSALAALVAAGLSLWWFLYGQDTFKSSKGVWGVITGILCSAIDIIKVSFLMGILVSVAFAVIGFIANDYSLMPLY